MSLRTRFGLWVGTMLAVVLAVFGALVYLNLARSVSASIDDSLRLSASEAMATVNIEDGRIDTSDVAPDGSAAADLHERGLTIRLLGSDGSPIQAYGPYRSLPVGDESLAAATSGESTFATLVDPAGHQPVRVFTTPVVDNGRLVGVFQVMRTLADLQDTLHRLLVSLLVGGPVLVLAAGVAGYYLAARALAPIDHIIRTARRISAADLSARLGLPPTDDEVGRLASTLDGMLGRLEDSFRRERQFTADASHELRTPLAAMQAILSVIRTERRTPEDYEQALADLAEETDRLRALAEQLLLLARAEDHPAVAADSTVDVSALVSDVAEALRPLAEGKELTLICDIADGLVTMGDSDDLVRLFANLIDNAIRNTAYGAIAVTARADDGTLLLTIRDTGSGISADHLPHIFERFYRGDASRSQGGAGLGLAIALAIAHRHGGTIDVVSTVGEGATFTVRLPRPSPPS